MAGHLPRRLQHQAELLQQVLQRQLEFERELVSRAVAPLRASLDLVDQATGNFHEQAATFRGVSKTFAQLADVMEQQARLLDAYRTECLHLTCVEHQPWVRAGTQPIAGGRACAGRHDGVEVQPRKRDGRMSQADSKSRSPRWPRLARARQAPFD